MTKKTIAKIWLGVVGSMSAVLMLWAAWNDPVIAVLLAALFVVAVSLWAIEQLEE